MTATGNAARMLGRRSELWGDSPHVQNFRKRAQRRFEHAIIASDLESEMTADEWLAIHDQEGWFYHDDDIVRSAQEAANVRSALLSDRDLILDTAGRLDLPESDLPGWANSVFDPADCQWGLRVTSMDKAPGVTSGRPQPAHLAT